MKKYIKPITKQIAFDHEPLMVAGSIGSGNTDTQLTNGFRRNTWSNGWDED